MSGEDPDDFITVHYGYGMEEVFAKQLDGYVEAVLGSQPGDTGGHHVFDFFMKRVGVMMVAEIDIKGAEDAQQLFVPDYQDMMDVVLVEQVDRHADGIAGSQGDQLGRHVLGNGSGKVHWLDSFGFTIDSWRGEDRG